MIENATTQPKRVAEEPTLLMQTNHLVERLSDAVTRVSRCVDLVCGTHPREASAENPPQVASISHDVSISHGLLSALESELSTLLHRLANEPE